MPSEQIEHIPTSDHKKTLLSLLVLILVGVGGWGVYSYYSKETLTPEQVLMVSTKNALEIDSSTFDVRVDVDFPKPAEDASQDTELFPGFELKNLVFNVKGSYDGHDLENPKYDLNMAVEADMFSVSAAFKMVDKMGYLRLEKVPVVAEEMARDFVDKWFSFSLESEEFEETLGGLTEEDKKFLYDTSVTSKSLKITEVLPLEKINGDISYHYSFTMDLVELKAYLIKIGEYANMNMEAEEGAELFDVNSFEEGFEAVKKIDGSVWISKKDKYMNKLVLDIEVAPDPSKTETVKTNVTATFGEFNKSSTVVAPTESTSFEEIFGDVFTPSEESLQIETE